MKLVSQYSQKAKRQTCEVNYLCDEKTVGKEGQNEPNSGIFVQNKIKR